MKKIIFIILLSIILLGSCGKESEKNTIDNSELIDTSVVKLDPNDFKESSEYLKIFAEQLSRSLDKKILILQKDFEKKRNIIGSKYTILIQKELDKNQGKRNEIIEKLEQEGIQKEEELFLKYQEDVRKLEEKQAKEMEQQIKIIDNKNLQKYEEKKKEYIKQELQKIEI